MEHHTYNINHNPLEYLPFINIICTNCNILYRIFLKDNKYFADLLYNNTRYNGESYDNINNLLLDMCEQIYYVLVNDITNHTGDDILNTIKYIKNKIENYIKCTN